MADLELRELRYFVAVAEELHFGRAAERLQIAQPAVSRAVRRLESTLGVELLERTSRQVCITPAGEALLQHARLLFVEVDRAIESARLATSGRKPLRLTMKPGGDGGLLPDILDRYHRHPDAGEVDIQFGSLADRAERLRDGRADVALLYKPLDDLTDFHHVVLATEQRVAILPRAHPLAQRDQLMTADLDGLTMARWKGAPGNETGPEVTDMAEVAVLVALDRAAAIVPTSTVGMLPAGIVAIPVADSTPSSSVLAWTDRSAGPAVDALAAVAVSVARERSRAHVL